ncbi:MAG: carbon-nitrogen hydrolase family protein [Candidatus Woesearchaeota archaeon]
MNKKENIKIAMGQLLVEGGEPWRNFERAKEMIKKASKNNCDLILLPEAIDFAWTHPSLYNEAKPIPGEFSDFFCKLAKKHDIFICLGLTEKISEDNFYNSALLINREGEILINYHKINLLDVEQPFYDVGNHLKVIDTEFGKIGINICADNYKNSVHIGKTLASMGAQIILSPSAWTVDHSITEIDEPYGEKWIKPLSYVANMYEILIVSTTSVGYIVGGPYEGKKMIGCSLAINKNGIIKKGKFNEFAGDLITFKSRIPVNKEKGTDLNNKILNKGFKPEVDLWKQKEKK